MAVSKKLINFLEKSKVKYRLLEHRTVYTAFDKAKTLKVPEKIIGKTLVLKIDGGLAIVLIGADKNLDLVKLKKAAKAKKLDFASEKLIKNRVKGVRVGAVPPFGCLWNMPTCADNFLLKQKEIILNSGDYNFSIKLKPEDFRKAMPDLLFGNYSKKKK